MSLTRVSSFISQVIDKIANFLIRDNEIGRDFRNFSQVEIKVIPQEELRERTLAYIFSRRVNHRSIFSYIKEKMTSLSIEEEKVAEALENSFIGVFEINKLLPDGFELYSLINERNYTVKTVGARTNYRGAYVGAYLYCCLCKIEEEYYVCDARAIMGSDKSGGAIRYAVTKIIEKPSLVFRDNERKLEEIREQINNLNKKFLECFNSREVITTNRYADDLINAFNDYCESGNDTIKAMVEKGIIKPEKYRYFPTQDFHFITENEEKKSIAGFSSGVEEYDVGIIYIERYGLFAIPFYGTFCQIFEQDEYQKIENYEECLNNFLNNDKIRGCILKFIAGKYKNFMSRINEILGTSYTINSLTDTYKPQSDDNENISTAAILYASKVFSQIMQREEESSVTAVKAGRNELCPCGSGKKYKKCCGR